MAWTTIDALLVDPRWQALHAHVPATGLVSDHLPVVADLQPR
jgi:endonuclease/exonuclease/phosphatase family metal-dependent hydrolase